MNLSTKILGACFLAPALAVAAFTAAYAAASPDGTASAAPRHAQATVHAAATTLDASEELSFVAIVPCRIVNTAASGGGGALTGGRIRSFAVSGSTGFGAQGGTSGGCAIPSAATAIAAVVTAKSTTVRTHTSSGVLRAWPANATESVAAQIMNYTNKVNISSGTTLPIAPAANPALKVHNLFGSTQLIIDVRGYYLPPIRADIESAGAFFGHSSRVVSVSHTVGSGFYAVTIDRAVEGPCSAQATPLDTGNFATAITESADVVNVRIFHLVSGAVTAGDDEFNFTVTC
jgi:hypothetical protein